MVDATTRFVGSPQGRIHQTFLFRTTDTQYILQCLNPQVVNDSTAFVTLINTVLAPASLAPPLLPWPATGECVLRHDTGRWICRLYISGNALTTQLSVTIFEAMAITLRQFHTSLTIPTLESSRFIGVNPWSGEATVQLKSKLKADTRRSTEEQLVVEQWERYRHKSRDAKGTANRAHVVVHRDTKSSNFIQKPDDTLVLIDFDTIGIGDPAFDLGEILRAWLSSDEHDYDSARAIESDNFKKDEGGSRVLTVGSKDCITAILALQNGYNDPAMIACRIKLAAMQCCLWQCERFLEDHFAGDVYYTVTTHGDNLYRAQSQLEALSVLDTITDF